ncbi:hypothetical protein BH23GEM6_BH23GEM6_06010 [soil metagenome]
MDPVSVIPQTQCRGHTTAPASMEGCIANMAEHNDQDQIQSPEYSEDAGGGVAGAEELTQNQIA